jgi:hypothetical protein
MLFQIAHYTVFAYLVLWNTVGQSSISVVRIRVHARQTLFRKETKILYLFYDGTDLLTWCQFHNVLGTAFTLADPKSAKITVKSVPCPVPWSSYQ